MGKYSEIALRNNNSNKRASRGGLAKFAIYLRELRRRKGMSLREVGAKSGVPLAYINTLETGITDRIPTPERLKKLANFYQTTTHEMLTVAGYYDKPSSFEEREIELEREFLHIISDPVLVGLKGLDARFLDPSKIDIVTKKFIIELYKIAMEK